uniref:Uncharacterized protein n=1 Tax=Rhizophora mucronata TaxID=61149 RepID=A0A2P2MY15_RHIMU
MWQFVRRICINQLTDRYNFLSFLCIASYTAIIMWFGQGESHRQ